MTARGRRQRQVGIDDAEQRTQVGVRDARLDVVLGQVDDRDRRRLGARAAGRRHAEQRQQRPGHGRALADRRVEVVVDAAGCVASSAAIFAVSIDEPPPSPTKPSKPPSRAASTASATRRLAGLDAAAGEDLGLDARRADRLDDRIDQADRREMRVGHDERARHARPAQVPAGLERRARAEHERRAGDGEDALVRAHGTTSHSSLPSVSLSSSNGIMRGTIARVEPVSRSEAASSLVDCEAANSVEVGYSAIEKPSRSKARRAEVGRAAVLRDVDEQRLADARRADRAQLVLRARRVDEDHVRAGGGVAVRARDRILEARDGDRVGARDDQRVGIRARVERGAQLLLVQLGRDHVLALHVPAALREDLILELDAGDAGALELVHGADHLRDLAVARVGVGDHGDRDRRAEPPRVVDHLGRARDAEVGQPEGRSRGGVPAAVDRLEAGALEQPAGERVERAGHDQDLAARRVARAAPAGARGRRSDAPFGVGDREEVLHLLGVALVDHHRAPELDHDLLRWLIPRERIPTMPA